MSLFIGLFTKHTGFNVCWMVWLLCSVSVLGLTHASLSCLCHVFSLHSLQTVWEPDLRAGKAFIETRVGVAQPRMFQSVPECSMIPRWLLIAGASWSESSALSLPYKKTIHLQFWLSLFQWAVLVERSGLFPLDFMTWLSWNDELSWMCLLNGWFVLQLLE